VINARGSERVT